MQESWPPPTSTAEAGEHLEESLDIPVYDGASSVDLPIGAGCSALVRHVLPNTPSTETVHMHLSFETLGQKSTFYPKIHILKIPIFTKFTFLKYHFSQNSPL